MGIINILGLFCKTKNLTFSMSQNTLYCMQKTFNEMVYDVVARIPYGRVATFGQIAQMIGRPRCARFVGYASNNRAYWHLPWHRVVFKNGILNPGMPDVQYRALRAEGVKFTPDKTVIMEVFQWNPERDGVAMDIRDFPLVF
jgi:methylated-DNA-protein-cysteine methyltransferase-like protein